LTTATTHSDFPNDPYWSGDGVGSKKKLNDGFSIAITSSVL
jgi:hypothetical protein